MAKLSFRLVVMAFAIITWATAALANPIKHAHGERTHAHKLPVPQGIQHTHGNLPIGSSLKATPKEPDEPNTSVPATSLTNTNEHIHGHIFHSHPLPATGPEHQHGEGTLGRPFIKASDFTFKESTWASFSDQVNSCVLVFISKGLSPKFNPYRDWGGLCNEIKDTKEFKVKAYKDYGKGGFFAYKGFERDYARLINMRVKDYEKVLTSSIPRSTYSGSSGGAVSVRGYYRKNGTYVRSHTRRRR